MKNGNRLVCCPRSHTMTTTDRHEPQQDDISPRILSLLTDAHAHPTDDPRLSGPDGIPTLARRITDEVQIGRVCAMSSNTVDQVLVRDLKREVDRLSARTSLDFRACFGYHPWYSHTISLQHPAPEAPEHYRSLFLSENSTQRTKDEVESLIPHLPTPRSLHDITSEVQSNLESFPDAMLGEVGLDRAFRVPGSKSAIKDQMPSERELLPSEPTHDCNEHTLALRGKQLTSLGIPIAHQHQVLLAQIGVAVELGRNVSMHSVRAPDATVNLIKECCRVYNGLRGRGFRDINIDLHSCTLSSQVLHQLMSSHPNVYASFSTTINANKSQKSLPSLLLTIPPTRLLIESDWHTSDEITTRNIDVCRLVAPYVVRTSFREVHDGEQADIEKAAKVLHDTWTRFERNEAVKSRLRDEGSQGYDSDMEEQEEDALRLFEEQWFKDVKKWQAKSSKDLRNGRSSGS